MKTIRPLRGQVLIQLDPADAFSGPIIIPEVERELSQFGTVRRIGAWPMNKKGLAMVPEVHKGDRVIVSQRAGRTLDGESKDFKLVPLAKVLAKLV